MIPNGIEVDATGNVYLTGDIANGLVDATPVSVNFGGSVGTVSGHVFVAKYSATGVGLLGERCRCLWKLLRCGVDANGNVYVTGDFVFTPHFRWCGAE